jgi:hypothetical protein
MRQVTSSVHSPVPLGPGRGSLSQATSPGFLASDEKALVKGRPHRP